MMRPTPDLERAAQLGDGLVVAVQADALGRELGLERHGELAAGADVEVEALLGDPAGGRDAEERLAGVVDVGAVGNASLNARARRRKSSSSTT